MSDWIEEAAREERFRRERKYAHAWTLLTQREREAIIALVEEEWKLLKAHEEQAKHKLLDLTQLKQTKDLTSA